MDDGMLLGSSTRITDVVAESRSSSLDLMDIYGPPTSGSSESVDKVIKHVNRLLFRGDLVPGQRLVEKDLTAEYGIGRGPIREALRILAGDGLIELRPGRSARVRRLTPAQVISILEAEVGLSCTGVELLIDRKRPPEELAALAEARDAIERAAEAGNPYDITHKMLLFAARVNMLSGNEYLNYLMGRTHFALYCREMIALATPGMMASIAPTYESILAGILAGDRARALAGMRRNLVRLRGDLEQAARQRGRHPDAD